MGADILLVIFTFLRLSIVLITIMRYLETLNRAMGRHHWECILVNVSRGSKNINSVFFCVLAVSLDVDLEGQPYH